MHDTTTPTTNESLRGDPHQKAGCKDDLFGQPSRVHAMKDINLGLTSTCQTGGFAARADVARACGIDWYSESLSLVLSGLSEFEGSLDAPDSMPAGSVVRWLGVIGGSHVYRGW